MTEKMTRQGVIDRLELLKGDYFKIALDIAIEALEADAVEVVRYGTWTEFVKKEPTKLGSYLVTYKNRFGGFEVDYDYWTIHKKFKYHEEGVVAWMIFPEPYMHGERNE